MLSGGQTVRGAPSRACRGAGSWIGCVSGKKPLEETPGDPFSDELIDPHESSDILAPRVSEHTPGDVSRLHVVPYAAPTLALVHEGHEVQKVLVLPGCDPLGKAGFPVGGCATLFPNATFVVRRSELRAAWWPEPYDRGYDFDGILQMRNLKYLQPPDNETFDVFEDGSIVCFDTRGHTEGHQSVLVNLPKSGRVVLTGDAVQVAQNFTEKVPPGLCWNSQLAVQAIDKLQHLQMEGALIIFGHELSQLEDLTLAPGYYD